MDSALKDCAEIHRRAVPPAHGVSMWRAVGERSLDCSASGRKNLRAHSVGRRSDALLGWGVVRAISIASASVSGRRSGSLSQDAFHTGRPGRRRGMLTCGFDGSGSDAFRAVATDRHEADGPQRQKVADPGYSARRVRRHFADTQDLILTGRFVASSSENRAAPLGHDRSSNRPGNRVANDWLRGTADVP